MKSNIYKIKCITNMHVGSGEINFNIVDNEVERDPVTGFPTINSSGLKGALRAQYNREEKDNIFGSAENNSGSIKFLAANLLFLAARSGDNKQVYYLATCKEAIKQYVELNKALGKELNENLEKELNTLSEDKAYMVKKNNAIQVDRYAYKEVSNMHEQVGKLILSVGKEIDKIVILPDKDFKKIALPVLARNQLNDKGISQNLWYEEVVPHESIFYFATLTNNDEDAKSFNRWIDNDGKFIQIGGNASIGYGLTEISRIDTSSNTVQK